MSKFWTIVLNVYKKNIKSIPFLIMILFPVILMLLAYVGGMLANNYAHETTIGIVSENEAIAKELEEVNSEQYSFRYFESKDAAENKLKTQDIDSILVITIKDDLIDSTLYSESSIGQVIEFSVNQLLNTIQASFNAEKLGLSAEQVANLNKQATFAIKKVSFDSNGKMKIGQDNTVIQSLISFIITIILFMIIMIYSSITAQEIASEKGTRIMEIILSSMKAQTHFYGKLVGILLVLFTQIAIYGVALTLGYSQIVKIQVVKDVLNGASLSNLLGSFLFLTILFLIFGIFVYSVFAALCGSLVSKPEDTAKAAQPIAYIAFIGYGIGIFLGTTDPQNSIIKISSYIPMISSFTMPIRLANETATPIEAIISLGILAVFGILLMLYSANLYKSNVLVYSDGGIMKSLKQSITLSRNERKK